MKDKILIVGGYGNVGKVISSYLGKKFPGKVIVAGRSYEKADHFANTTKRAVLPMEFNVSEDHATNSVLDEIFLVVMCLDQKNIKFVETCINKGIHYIDITASYELVSDIEEVAGHAEQKGTTIVLSVGLAPGITNLIIKHCKQQFDVMDEANIYLLLGLGDHHGKAAIEWTVDNMNTVYDVVENETRKKVRSFEDGKATFFCKQLGKRMAYPFNFTDQHILPRTLGIKKVTTRLCFDSKFFTGLLAILKRIRFFNLLKLNSFRRLFIKVFEKVKFGSDIFAVKIDATGQKDGKKSEYYCSIVGHKEGFITGKVAGMVAEKIYTGVYASGVYHIEQLFEPKEILSELEKNIEINYG